MISYTIVLFIRLLFLDQINTLQDIPTLWGSDGALYGYYAKQLLLGNTFNFDTEHMPGYLLFFFVKLTSLSLDKVLFYSPAFLASLSVIPVILIGYAYNILRFSFFVSIIGSITYTFYIRSFLGYYDTDLLNVTLSLTIVAFMILFVEKKDFRYLILSAVFIYIFTLWYHSSKLIIFAIIANFILFIIIKNRKNLFKSNFSLLIIVAALTIISVFYSSEINSFLTRGYDYIFKVQNINLVQNDNNVLHFKSTLSTVNEAKPLQIDKLGKYFSVPNWYLILSFISLLLFYTQFKSFTLTISLLAISILSVKAGIRFSEYGVLIIAFGSVYFLYIIKNILIYFDFNKYLVKALFSLSILILIYQYITIVINKNKFISPIMSAQTVDILHKFDKNISDKDFILTWWDYGWPLWYYTKANTLIDNGKHFEDTYIISKLLFSPQEYTAKASKYYMDQCKNRQCYLSRTIFKNAKPAEIDEKIHNYQIDTKSSHSFKKDTYFFFHSRMVKIMKVISEFSNMNLETGLKNKDRLTEVFKIRNIKNGILNTRNSKIKLHMKKHFVIIGNKKLPLKDIHIVNNKINKIETKYNNSEYHAVIYQNKYIILCNNTIFNSFFIQAMVLNNHDKNHFKLIDSGHQVKILKLIN